jgi:E3 ubiquitin-protein ligase RAD18
MDEPKIIELPPRIPTPESEIRCPICQRPFKTVEQVDLHIDSCTGPQRKSPPAYNFRPPKPASVPIRPPSSRARSIQPVNPLPKLNYALYNEAKLRTLLAEHGLSTYGNKTILAARHREYVNLYNANIDRRNPQSRQEILKQLEKWDLTQQTSARQDKRKELDTEEWERKCKDEFSELTRLARESGKRRKLEGQNETSEGTPPSAVRSSQEKTVE